MMDDTKKRMKPEMARLRAATPEASNVTDS